MHEGEEEAPDLAMESIQMLGIIDELR